MSLSFNDRWVWDSWLIREDGSYHLFFLNAPRDPIDPERRHRNARIGHAISEDLVHWRELGEVVSAGDAGEFDAGATWTGSVVRDGDRWTLFYTGSVFPQPGHDVSIQTIGTATSGDLTRWNKRPAPRIAPDPRWYESRDTSADHGQAWRDPWVFRDPADKRWHMLITARSNAGDDELDRGVIGHATSEDLETWTVREPLSSPGAGFFHLEVPTVATVDDRDVLLFSCFGEQLAGSRLRSGDQGGIWAINLDHGLDRIDASSAYLVASEINYCGHVTTDPEGDPVMITFRATDSTGTFIGSVADPLPLSWSDDGRLTVIERS